MINITITIQEKDNNQDYIIVTRYFNPTNDNSNKKLLGNAILYVGTNYRNKAAHKDLVPKVLYEEAKALLMSTECLLWILMYILK